MRRFQFGLMALCGILLASCATSTQTVQAPPPFSAQDTARAERLDAFLAQVKSKGIVPGASVLVYQSGRETYFKAVGNQDREAETPFTRDTIVRVYSMTKPITGIALMMLFEEGKFALDDPISKFMPEYADLKVFTGLDAEGNPQLTAPNRPVTVRDLMRHTAGMTYGVFGDTPVDKMYRKSGLLGYDRTNEQLSHDLGTMPLLFQPGETWHYSVAVDVQGRLIEVLSGQTLGVFLKNRIFDPLGMKDTGFMVPKDQQARFAAMYQLNKKGVKRLGDEPPFSADSPFITDVAFESGGGGLVSSIDDYMRFARMLQNEGILDGARLVNPKTLHMMTQDQLGNIAREGLGEDNTFGLDFAIRTDHQSELAYAPGSFYWGGLAGTFFFVDPANDLTVVMYDQLIGADAVKLRERMARAVYGPSLP